MKQLTRIALVLAICCLAAAGYFYTRERPYRPLVVTPTFFEFESVPAGELEFVIHISNPTTVHRRVIGLGGG